MVDSTKDFAKNSVFVSPFFRLFFVFISSLTSMQDTFCMSAVLQQNHLRLQEEIRRLKKRLDRKYVYDGYDYYDSSAHLGDGIDERLLDSMIVDFHDQTRLGEDGQPYNRGVPIIWLIKFGYLDDAETILMHRELSQPLLNEALSYVSAKTSERSMQFADILLSKGADRQYDLRPELRRRNFEYAPRSQSDTSNQELTRSLFFDTLSPKIDQNSLLALLKESLETKDFDEITRLLSEKRSELFCQTEVGIWGSVESYCDVPFRYLALQKRFDLITFILSSLPLTPAEAYTALTILCDFPEIFANDGDGARSSELNGAKITELIDLCLERGAQLNWMSGFAYTLLDGLLYDLSNEPLKALCKVLIKKGALCMSMHLPHKRHTLLTLLDSDEKLKEVYAKNLVFCVVPGCPSLQQYALFSLAYHKNNQQQVRGLIKRIVDLEEWDDFYRRPLSLLDPSD